MRYDTITLEDVATYPRPGTAVPRSIGFTPDSRRVTYLSSAEGSLVLTLESQNFRGGNVFFSPDGEYLAATSDTTLGTNLWWVNDWSLEHVMPIWGSAFTPDSKAVLEIVGSGVILWQVGERKMVKGWQKAEGKWQRKDRKLTDL